MPEVKNGAKALFWVTRIIPVALAVLALLVSIVTAYFTLEKRICLVERDFQTHVESSCATLGQIQNGLKELKCDVSTLNQNQTRLITILEIEKDK